MAEGEGLFDRVKGWFSRNGSKPQVPEAQPPSPTPTPTETRPPVITPNPSPEVLVEPKPATPNRPAGKADVPPFTEDKGPKGPEPSPTGELPKVRPFTVSIEETPAQPVKASPEPSAPTEPPLVNLESQRLSETIISQRSDNLSGLPRLQRDIRDRVPPRDSI